MSFDCRWTQETVQNTTAQRYSWEIGGRRKLGRFGKSRTETYRIARRASEVEVKTNSNKGADLEGLSVTQRVMSVHRKDKK